MDIVGAFEKNEFKEVVETVFLDWGLSFGAGVLFAIAGRNEVQRAPHKTRTRAFLWGLAYLHLGILAISLTLYALNRDWMWMYWVEPSTLPAGIVVLAFLLYEVCYVAGFFIASELTAKKAWGIAGAAFIAISALEITARNRLFHFDWARPEGWVAVTGGIASAVALVAMLVVLARRSKVEAALH